MYLRVYHDRLHRDAFHGLQILCASEEIPNRRDTIVIFSDICLQAAMMMLSFTSPVGCGYDSNRELVLPRPG